MSRDMVGSLRLWKLPGVLDEVPDLSLEAGRLQVFSSYN